MKYLTLALLAVACLLFNGTTVFAADDVYSITIKRAEVKETKADGSDWDINKGKPDLAVIVKNIDDKDSKSYTTKTKDDVFSATWDEATTVRVRAGQTIEFEVVDVDVAVNDSAGKIKKELTAETLKAGKLKLEKFGQVIYLEVEFKKL